jgi:hypothetical protein
MMIRQLNQALPIDTMPENLWDTRGKAAVGIVAATSQNQIEFGSENSSVWSYRRGQPGWRRLWQGDGRR